jgi:hypothetical protein
MGVAQGVDAETGHKVQIAVAGGVKEMNSKAVVHHNGIACVDGKEVIGVAMENLGGVGILPKMRHDLTITQDAERGVKRMCGPESRWMRQMRNRKPNVEGTKDF